MCNTSFATQAKLSVHWQNVPSCGQALKEDGDKGGLVVLRSSSGRPKKIRKANHHQQQKETAVVPDLKLESSPETCSEQETDPDADGDGDGDRSPVSTVPPGVPDLSLEVEVYQMEMAAEREQLRMLDEENGMRIDDILPPMYVDSSC